MVPPFSDRLLASILIPSASLSPANTVYLNTSSSLPEPDSYVAVRFAPPTFNVSCGTPITVTASEKLAVTLTSSPAFSQLF